MTTLKEMIERLPLQRQQKIYTRYEELKTEELNAFEALLATIAILSSSGILMLYITYVAMIQG